MGAINWAEQGRIPDFLIRLGIRRLLADRLRTEGAKNGDTSLNEFVAQLDASPIAIATDKANEQHYEVPSAYFTHVLGPRRKYSATIWPDGVSSLAESEEAMLRLTAERAAIRDGDRILELGCGWGSFSLWAAEHFPRSEVVGVSNSASQRAYIEEQAAERGLTNLRIVTCDMNEFEPDGAFDRIVSIEMFEHMKNYRKLMQRIAGWLRTDGTLFVHIFTHRRFAYAFEDEGSEDDWMARYFFTGGNMPSDDLLLRFQDDLRIDAHWRINGVEYSRTLEAWLQQHDAARESILPLFAETYGSAEAGCLWFHRWRLFYLACSELFRYNGGTEWLVSHYRFRKPARAIG
jgi:cyclopropane-fatty-acyl-phospholipid synthase